MRSWFSGVLRKSYKGKVYTFPFSFEEITSRYSFPLCLFSNDSQPKQGILCSVHSRVKQFKARTRFRRISSKQNPIRPLFLSIEKNFLPYLFFDGIIKSSIIRKVKMAASPSGLRPRFAKPLSWVRIPEPPIFKKISCE